MDKELDPYIQTWRCSLNTSRQHLVSQYQVHRQPQTFLKAHSQVVDNIICSIWDNLALGRHAALIAVGGYGREQLFPHSDVDLLILLPPTARPGLEDILGYFLSIMWDIGLNVGHSVRTHFECLAEADADITVETTLLESRFITGDISLYQALADALERTRDPLEFFDAKVLEQQSRHQRFLGVTNNLEPNIKESPGGLRDLQTILWISKAIGLGSDWEALSQRSILTLAEARLITHSERQLQKLRIDLHLFAKRREDRLIFDWQQQLGQAWALVDSSAKRASEQVMQLYYRAAKTISQLNGILLPNLKMHIYSQIPRITGKLNERFYTVNGMLAIRHPDVFEKQPTAILEAFLMLQRNPTLTGFAPPTLRALWHARAHINERFRQHAANRRLFMGILRSAGLTRALRWMNLYGVLGKYLPSFGRIIGQMQHDLFHVYTVDEHILMVIHNLRQFTLPNVKHQYPFLSHLMNNFERREILYLAGLFHDIAKGRGGDHSLLGMEDAQRFCVDHNLSHNDSQLVAWLVKEHLTMSRIAQKHDIYDPETVHHFAKIVVTERRLTALYLLTVADIRGTNPTIWNAWKAKLLEDLYTATLRLLARGGILDPTIEQDERKREAKAMLQLYALPDGVENVLWDQLDTGYFLRHKAQEIAWHTRLLYHFVNTRHPLINACLSDDGGGLQVMVYTPDQPELFVRICTFFGHTHYSIADAKIYTTQHGYALDTFHIFIPDYEQTSNDKDVTHFIECELATALTNSSPPPLPQSGRISRHLKHFPISPQVIVRADERTHFYVLSIVAGDQPGLLARIARVLADYQLSVYSAKITTLGSRVEDSFLITGSALADAQVVIDLKAELINVLRI